MEHGLAGLAVPFHTTTQLASLPTNLLQLPLVPLALALLALLVSPALAVEILLFSEAPQFSSAQKEEALHQLMLGQSPMLAGVHLLAVAVVGLVGMLALVVLGLGRMGRLVPLELVAAVALVPLELEFSTTLLLATSMCSPAAVAAVLGFLVKAPMAPLALHLSLSVAAVVAALLAQAGQLLLAMKEETLAHMEAAAVVAYGLI